jgi:hypothetical protein
MTFAPRYERISTYTRGVSRSGDTPRISDAETVNQPAAKRQSFRSPTLGLMLDDNTASIPDGGALVLDNWYPLSDRVRVMGGSVQRNTGLAAEVTGIWPYETGATRRCFATTTTEIYEVTTAGVAVRYFTGLVNTVWSTVMFTTSGGTFLVMCGAGNIRLLFDGTVFSGTPLITFPPGTVMQDLAQVWVHANRLFFVKRNSTNAFYLNVDNVGGAAVQFPLGGEFPRGGELLCGGTWATEVGNSLTSLCAFFSTEGDVVLYEGSDPATWTRRNTFSIPRPCGINCLFQSGGDLAIMTEDGLYSMSQIVSTQEAALSEKSISKNIRPLWRARAGDTTTTRWRMIRRSREGMAVVAPVLAGQGAPVLFLANIETGAWSTRSGWSPTAIGEFGGQLLYGTVNGRIMQGDTGGSDDGRPYSSTYIGSFISDGGASINGRMMQYVVASIETTPPRCSAKYDYDTSIPAPPPAGAFGERGAWNGGAWDQSIWDGVRQSRKGWQAVEGRGSAVAPMLTYSFSQALTPSIDLIRTDLIYETGEVMT